jgi:outer membrane lipoprotein-sorting protein
MRAIVLVAGVVCAALCAAAEGPDAKELLRDSKTSVFSQGPFRLESQSKIDMPATGMKMDMNMKTAADSGKYRLDVSPLNISIVSDGDWMYIWMGPMKQYMKTAAPKSPDEISKWASKSGSFSNVMDASSAVILRTEAVDVVGRKFDCYVIEATFDEAASTNPPGASVSGKQISWIDKDRHLELRQVADLALRMAAGADPMKMHIETNVTLVDLSPVFGPDEFRFTPPEGAKQVDSLPGMPASK